MNNKWDNIDPGFDNDNTINGWKLKVLDVEMFMIERPNMSSFDTAEIQTAINSSLALLDAECNGLIQEVWFVTDTTSSLYRSGKEKNYIREAAIMQTQYFINLGNDYTDGSTSFNASGISASFQRPLDKKNIAPGVFVLLQKGRVYELQSYDLGRNMSVNKQPTNTSLANYVQFGVGDVRYVTYNQMPYNRQEGSLLYVDKGEIKFFTVDQLDLTVPRAYLIWDKATKSFEDIHDVKDIAFFGNQLDNAITRQEAEELIAASPSGVSKEYVDDGLTLKQNKLTAGTNITITDDVISASGGVGDVTLDTAQTITGAKTFSNKLTLNKNLNFEIAGSNAAFIDWYKDGVRLAYFGKGGSTKNEIQLEVVADLVFNAANIKFSGKELKKITTPTADDSASTKKYVDDNVLLKQNKLTAGTNITITDDVISASGGSTGNFVTLDTNQTITGGKDFKNAASFYGDAFCFRAPADKYGLINKENLDNGLALKQNTLTAGTGIDITGDTISSTGGATGNFVTLDTDQEITGKKTFNTGITIKNQTTNERFEFETTASGVLRVVSSGSFQLYLNRKTTVAFYKDFVNFLNSRLTNIGDPTNEKDATTKKYVDDGLTLKANQTDVVDLSSTQAVRGNKTFMNACYVNNAPTNGKGIANKEYVDGKTLTNVDTLIKSATTTIPSLTTAGDSTQTITSIFDAATWDLIKESNAYYLLAYTSSRSSRTGFPMVIRMEYAMTSNDYNIHTGAGDFTFFSYTDYATTYAIKVMVALSRGNGSFRFAASFNGTLNANFNINRIEIWKKGTV